MSRTTRTSQIDLIIWNRISRIKPSWHCHHDPAWAREYKNNEKKQRLTSVQNEKGEIQYDRQEIVDVFASFYETLYAKRGAGAERSQLRPNTSSNHQILAITGQEVEKQLMSMEIFYSFLDPSDFLLEKNTFFVQIQNIEAFLSLIDNILYKYRKHWLLNCCWSGRILYLSES